MTGVREFRKGLGDTTCTCNVLDGARVIVTSSTNSLTWSMFQNDFADKEVRFPEITYDAVIQNGGPDHFDIKVGKRIVSIWVFWPDSKSDKSGSGDEEIAFLRSTAKIFADIPS